MTIKQFNKLDDIPSIEKFKSVLPVFAEQKYANFLKKTGYYSVIWVYGIGKNNTELIIPFAIKKKYFFRIGIFLTSIIRIDETIDTEMEKDFLNSITADIKSKKLCDWIQQSPNSAIFSSYPDGADFAHFGSYKINLQKKTIDELFNSIQPKDRSDIRKAVKEGVVIKCGFNFLDDAMGLITATAYKANISLPTNRELNFLKDNVCIFVSYYQNVPQTSAIFYYNKFAWYNMYAGSKDKPFRGANSLLYWSAIKTAKEEGVRIFDFVGARINPEAGSKQESIQRFKEHFGVDLCRGFIWKMPISKSKSYIYRSLLKAVFVIRRKELKGDIIDQELRRLNR